MPPLDNAKPSADVVATAVLDALSRRDLPALEALALNDTEFRNHVWPELPASRPERNLPYSYVWGDLQQKSRLALKRTLEGHGGRLYTLLQVGFGGRTEYESYTVHRETTLRVRDTTGVEHELRLWGSMLEQDGEWKVFSYVVDD